MGWPFGDYRDRLEKGRRGDSNGTGRARAAEFPRSAVAGGGGDRCGNSGVLVGDGAEVIRSLGFDFA